MIDIHGGSRQWSSLAILILHVGAKSFCRARVERVHVACLSSLNMFDMTSQHQKLVSARVSTRHLERFY